MGVPAFFRWLSKKYPSIVVPADKGVDHGYHFDNLYLDMNGIIHPCTHPEHKAPPETEEEMFEAIFEYIDMLMEMVKPTKLLYMAVDGVAPRAKMNQQRMRRFRAVKESADKKAEVEKIKQELRASGIEFEEKIDTPHFDSNVITPGTQFMINLSKALRERIDRKLDPNYDEPEKRDEYGNIISSYIWPKDLVVILSDASVPGEGEHKIIDYVRRQKAHPDYNPNLSHCLCGADADLIMLGLATHELNFTILREEFVPNQPRPCEICAQYGHEMKDCRGKANQPDSEVLIRNQEPGFIYIRLCVLREYFSKDCEDLNLERYIDDFVFICFFVGNDFLPHLPSLEIREGAIDRLLNIYKKLMAEYAHPKPYLTQDGFVELSKIEYMFTELGKMEEEIFRKRRVNDVRYRERTRQQKLLDHKALHNNAWMAPQQIVKRGETVDKLSNIKAEASQLRAQTSALRLDAMLEKDASSNVEATSPKKVEKPFEEDDEPEDNVQLWNSGFKERYYFLKFGCNNYSPFNEKLAKEYARGLCWVLRYYYQGCPDWQWFYPFHYAPFASDFKNVKDLVFEFASTAKPFRPLEQLMSVFPAGSCQNLPPTWQRLMKDPNSPIIDFYPSNFRIDLNGKKAAWQGVALLPFIEEPRLFDALESVYKDITIDEMERNSLGPHLIFISRSLEPTKNALEEALKQTSETDCSTMEALYLFGKIKRSEKFSDNYLNSFCFEYYDPQYSNDFVFLAQRLKKAKSPENVLKPEDFQRSGRGGGRGGYNNYNHNSNFRPTIGFNQRSDRATLGQYGHRTLNQHINSGQRHSSSSQQRQDNYGGYRGYQGNVPYQGNTPYQGNIPYQGNMPYQGNQNYTHAAPGAPNAYNSNHSSNTFTRGGGNNRGNSRYHSHNSRPNSGRW